MFKKVLIAFSTLSILLAILYIVSIRHKSDLNDNIAAAPIDVVIPAIAKDTATIDYCIEGIKKNCKNIRRVIVISKTRLTDKAEWFDEANYPFSKYDVALYLNNKDPETAKKYMNSPDSRLGWYYQQLLKFYAPKAIPGISSNILIVDADTVFFRPVEFVNANGGGNYTIGFENPHQPYFDHMKRLLPGLKRAPGNRSGICHHMLFQKNVLDDLFNRVETTHHNEFWKAFCLCVSPNELMAAGASEYEIYYNFVFMENHQAKIRPLIWKNSGELQNISKHATQGYDYISYHAYLR